MIDIAFFGEIITEYSSDLICGAGYTLLLSGMAGISGFFLSAIIALARSSWRRFRSLPAQLYIFCFRSTPLLVQLFLVYHGLAQFEAIQDSFIWERFLKNAFWCSYVVLTLNTAAYMAQLLYGGLLSIPTGELEACRALGMSRFKRFYRIAAPRAFRIALPNYSNEVILLIKGSALASTITVTELTYVTRTLIGDTYKSIELYIVAGLLYVIISMVVAGAFQMLETKLMPWKRLRHGRKISKREQFYRGIGV